MHFVIQGDDFDLDEIEARAFADKDVPSSKRDHPARGMLRTPAYPQYQRQEPFQLQVFIDFISFCSISGASDFPSPVHEDGAQAPVYGLHESGLHHLPRRGSLQRHRDRVRRRQHPQARALQRLLGLHHGRDGGERRRLRQPRRRLVRGRFRQRAALPRLLVVGTQRRLDAQLPCRRTGTPPLLLLHTPAPASTYSAFIARLLAFFSFIGTPPAHFSSPC